MSGYQRYPKTPDRKVLKRLCSMNTPLGVAVKRRGGKKEVFEEYKGWGKCAFMKGVGPIKLGRGGRSDIPGPRYLKPQFSCFSIGCKTDCNEKFGERVFYVNVCPESYLWVCYGSLILPVPENLEGGKIIKLNVRGEIPKHVTWIKNNCAGIGISERICKKIYGIQKQTLSRGAEEWSQNLYEKLRDRTGPPKRIYRVQATPNPYRQHSQPESTAKNLVQPSPLGLSRRKVELHPPLSTKDENFKGFVKSSKAKANIVRPPPPPMQSRFTLMDNEAPKATFLAGFEMGIQRGRQLATLNLDPAQEHLVKAGGGLYLSSHETNGNLLTTAHDQFTEEVRVIQTSRKIGNRWTNNDVLGASFSMFSILPMKQAQVLDAAAINRLSFSQIKANRKNRYIPMIFEYSENRLKEQQAEIKRKLAGGIIRVLFIAMDGQWNSRRRRGHRAKHNVVSFIVYLSDGSRYFVHQAFATRHEEFYDLIDLLSKSKDQLTPVKCLEKIAVQKGLQSLFELDIITPLIVTDACCKAIRAITELYAHLVEDKTSGAVIVRYNLDSFHVMPKREGNMVTHCKEFDEVNSGAIGKDFISNGGIACLRQFYTDSIKRSEGIEDFDERVNSCKDNWEQGIIDWLKDNMAENWDNRYVSSGLVAYLRLNMADSFETFNTTEYRTTDVEVYHSRYSRKDNKAQPIGFEGFKAAQGINRMHHQLTFDLDDMKKVTRTDVIPDGTGRTLPRESFTHEERLELFKTLNRNVVDSIVFGTKQLTREEIIRLTRLALDSHRTGVKRRREHREGFERDEEVIQELEPAKKKRKLDHIVNQTKNQNKV